MLNEDSDASEPEEKAQEDTGTVPTSTDEPPAQSVTDSDSSSDDDARCTRVENVVRPVIKSRSVIRVLSGREHIS